MPVYRYVGVDRSGRTRTGVIDADSSRAALSRLRETGIYASDISPATENLRQGKRNGQHFSLETLKRAFRRVQRQEVGAVTTQIAVLLEAGLPLEEVLSGLLSSGLSSSMQAVLAQVRERLREGRSFADALREHPRVFNHAFCAMIAAGESSGALDVVMAQLAAHLEQQAAVRRSVRSALAYPVLMLVVGLGIVFYLLAYIVPQVTQVFSDLDHELPLVTQILITLGNVVERFWFVVPVLVLGLIVLFRRWKSTKRGRAAWHRLLLRLPVAGGLVRNLCLGRVAGLLGMLLQNGVLLENALVIAREAAGLQPMECALDEISDRVRAGGGVSATMLKESIFPPTAVQMVAAGERSGRLEEMLTRVGANAEAEARSGLATTLALFEPLMILSLGLIVGFVVVAIMLPILQMSQLAG